jgi:uncharacterized protein (TIGR02001 family)
MHNLARRARSFFACGGAALVCLTAPALAEDREFSFSATAGGTSDYIFRGISLNDENPAAQGSLDIGYGIFYAGIWGSNVSGLAAPSEFDFYVGLKPVLGPVTFDLGVIYYYYPDGDDAGNGGEELDYVEFKLGGSISPVTNLSLGLTGYYSPDQSGGGEEYAIEGSAGYTFHSVGIFTPTLGGALGWQGFENAGVFVDGDDYTYWNIGLALAVEKFTFDFRYWDTDIADNDAVVGGLADERFVFSAKVTLP